MAAEDRAEQRTCGGTGACAVGDGVRSGSKGGVMAGGATEACGSAVGDVGVVGDSSADSLQ